MPTCPDCREQVAEGEEFCDACGHFLGGQAPGVSAQSGAASERADVTASSARTMTDPLHIGDPALLSGGHDTRSGKPCPACDTPRLGVVRFCEECGYDFTSGERPVPPAPAPSQEPSQTPTPTPTPPTATRPPSGPHPVIGAPRGPVGPSLPSQVGAAGPAGASGGRTIVAEVAADRDYFESMIAHGGADAATVSFPLDYPERRLALSGQAIRIGRHSRSRGIVPEIDLTGPPEDPGVSHRHAVLLLNEGGWVLIDVGSYNGTRLNDIADPIPHDEPVPVGDGDRIYVGAWTRITLRETADGTR